ncbi:MAG: DUF433 domain-containing protein [Bacteroidetes bacterium]|nr:DUF433 domain-containing protein [Bacteroidota bacterium]
MNHDRIISDHRIMLGKPVIKGTRITVEIIIRKMAEGASIDDILKMYSHLTREDVQAALAYTADTIAGEEMVAAA